MRKRGRVDANQATIAAAFRGLGATVKITSNLGDGFGDMVVGAYGVNRIVECKDGSKPASQRKLTPSERKFHDDWKGTIDIIESTDDVIELLAIMRGCDCI